MGDFNAKVEKEKPWDFLVWGNATSVGPRKIG